MVERINKIKGEKANNDTEFAKMIGVSQRSMSYYLTGSRGVNLDIILRILDRFPDISSDWLLFGKGEMHKKSVAFTGNESDAEIDLHAQLIKTEAELEGTRDKLARAEAAVENMQELLGYHREKIAELNKEIVRMKKERGKMAQKAV